MTATLADANQLFLQGTLALAQVERNGIRIDTERLDRTILKIGFKIDILNKELIEHETADIWRKVYGNKTNFGSREQLGKILFNHLNYEYKGEKTKTDRYRADDEIVRETGDKFAKKILEIEHLKKTRSTYLGGIKKETVDGFLHAVFNLHFVTTFRSSSDSPNFQNIPIRDVSIGRMIRKLFVPREKRVLIEIDFQASEFKGAAAFWRDPKMVAYASDPTKDIHRDMAMKCYCLEKDQVSKDARYCAKNGFVFPRLYGSFHKQIARHMWDMIDEKHLRAGKEEIAIPMRKHLQSKGILELGECNPKGYAQPKTFEYHIKSVEDWFDKEFNVFRDSREKWITDYRKRGWFQMMTGFIVKGLYTNNFLLNAPIQGPMFHCLLWSLIQLQKWLNKYKMKSLIVGQIHDCLLLDVPIDEIQDVLHTAKDIMTTRLRKAWDWLIVPMGVEVDVTPEGGSWADKALWVEENGEWKPKQS